MFVYKFFPVCVYDRGTRAPRVWTRDVIVRSKLFLSSPLSFNDPYDCMVVAVLDGREEEFADFLAAGLSPSPTSEDRKRAAARMRDDPEHKRMLEDEVRRELVKRQAVCSFASDSAKGPAYSNLLMWSHYADHHKGVCLEFELERLRQLFPMAPVSYSNECQPFNNFDVFRDNGDDDRHVERHVDWVLTKAKCWDYECEWRIYAEGVGAQSFPPPCLTKVILGAQMPPDDEAIVRDWLSERVEPVALYRASLESNAFRIQIKQID